MSATLYGETEARYAALSGLVHGARVLDLAIHGDARCIDALVTAGATSITVCAPEQVRRDLTTQNLELQLVPPVALPLTFSPGSFDVVVCFDLIARIAQDPAWMSGLREVLTPGGAIVIATSSADDAARILGASFGVATVFAQTPLVGHMLYDVGAEELEPELDRTWADGADDEPTSYVVIFAPEPRHNEKLTMVQMPFAAWERVASSEGEALRAERDLLKQEVAAANEQIARSRWQLGGASNELEATHVELTNARGQLEVAVNELASLRQETDHLHAQSPTPADVNEELARHRSDRASLEAQIADLLEESAAMSAAALAWEERLARHDEEVGAESARVAEAERRACELEAALNDAQARAGELEAALNDAQARAGELEAAADDAQARSSELEATVAELHARLTETAAAPAPAPADDDLALDQARYLIAELESAAARDQTALAELQDTIAVERGAARDARQAAESERDTLKRRLEDLQRALDMSRRRGDDLARSLDLDRQQLAELKDRVESERQRANELEKALSSNSSKEIAPPTGQKAIDGES